jgi:hypothetical protein
MESKQFVITKKIASQGKRAVILIPTLLQDDLRQGTVVKLTIDILKEAEKNE